MEPFQELHGLRACMVAPTKIIAGLGMSLGMQCLDVPGATGGYTEEHPNARPGVLLTAHPCPTCR